MRIFRDKTLFITKTFTSHDWACFHDAVLDATDKSYRQKKLEEIFEKLPSSIKFTAFEWGMSDTVFRDNVCEHLEPKPAPLPSKEYPEGAIIITTGFKGTGKLWDNTNCVRFHKPIEPIE